MSALRDLYYVLVARARLSLGIVERSLFVLLYLKKFLPLSCGKNKVHLEMKEITMCARRSKKKVNVNGGQSNVVERGFIV